MSTTPNLELPYLMPAQAQKHVTHNEALRGLDAIVQIGVLDRDLTAPPASPGDGDRFIVAATATGTWSGKDLRVAAWQDGAWMFYTPRPGWLAWIADEGLLAAWDGTAWIAASSGVGGGGGVTDHGALAGLGDDDHPQYLNEARGDARYLQSVNPVALVGVNATADTTNRLAVAAPASLFNHAGAGHQQKINKATAGDTASVLYQTGFSGRAEVGLTGDDDFHFKVSGDGATWNEAIVIDKDTGEVSFPNTTIGGGGGGGEANTASNVGDAGLSMFIEKVGVDLRFRKVTNGSGISVTTSGAGQLVILNSQPVPTGGTTGQVLAKLSNTNNHVGWQAPTGTPPIVGRMPPIGPDGLDFKLGPTGVHVAASNQTLTANRLYMARFVAPEALTLAEIGIRVATGAAGHTCRLGLYAPHTNGLPGALLVDSGDLPVDAAGYVSAVISQAMTAGQICWLACTCSGAPGVLGAASGTAGQPVLGWNVASGAQGLWSILRTRSGYGPLDADESGAVWFTSSSQPSPFVFLDI